MLALGVGATFFGVYMGLLLAVALLALFWLHPEDVPQIVYPMARNGGLVLGGFSAFCVLWGVAGIASGSRGLGGRRMSLVRWIGVAGELGALVYGWRFAFVARDAFIAVSRYTGVRNDWPLALAVVCGAGSLVGPMYLVGRVMILGTSDSAGHEQP